MTARRVEAPAEQQPLQQATQSGSMATRSAATPDGMRLLRPYDGAVPAQEEAAPTTAAARHCGSRWAPRASAARSGEGGEEGAGDQETHRRR